MSDRLYGGIRAGRTGVSLAVLLRREDTMKGLTGVAPAGGAPTFVNGIGQGDTSTATPTVVVFTPGAGANYLVVKWSGRQNEAVASVACAPTAGGTTINLTAICPVQADTQSGQFGMYGGFVPGGIEYTITVTWTPLVAWSGVVQVCAYAGVGSVGTPAFVTGTGSKSINVDTGGTSALVIDAVSSQATPTFTPTAGQTPDGAAVVDGSNVTSLRGGWKAGTGTVAMSWTSSDGCAIAGIALKPVAGSAITAAYVRQGAASAAVPLVALAGPTAAWAAGGWAELDVTKMPGLYRLDVPDAAVAVGADHVTVEVVCAGAIEYVERLGLETRRSLRAGVAYAGLMVFLQNADGTAHTGGTVTGQKILDGGTPAALTNAVIEIGGGVWKVDLAAADTPAPPGVFGCYLFTATGAVPRAVLITFEP